MALARQKPWTMDAFLAWERAQPERYELIDGQPVAMTGGTQAHDLIKTNLAAALRAALRGGSCRPGGSDLKVVTGNGRVRYPDGLVDCGPYRPEADMASDPVAVFEVLSRSTSWFDLTRKLEDYGATPGIQTYVALSQDEVRAVVFRRVDGRLVQAEVLLAAEAMVEAGPAAVALADLYEDTGLLDT